MMKRRGKMHPVSTALPLDLTLRVRVDLGADHLAPRHHLAQDGRGGEPARRRGPSRVRRGRAPERGCGRRPEPAALELQFSADRQSACAASGAPELDLQCPQGETAHIPVGIPARIRWRWRNYSSAGWAITRCSLRCLHVGQSAQLLHKKTSSSTAKPASRSSLRSALGVNAHW